MPLKLQPLDAQVMVITGATSGIGLTTARMAAEAGARLVLVARAEEALQQLVEELRSTFLRQSGATRSIMYRAIGDLSLWSRLMEIAEKDFASSAKPDEHTEPEKAG